MRALLNLVLIFGLSLGAGLGSAWYLIENGSVLTTRHVGPWTVWGTAGNPKSDPYTRAHLARSGRLPITSTNALYYFANTDMTGEPLSSDCEYVIDGTPMNSAWWSLAVYNEENRLIANEAGRHAYSSRNVVRRNDGTYRIVLARTARPGNWLPTGDSDGLQLLFRIYGPQGSDSTTIGRSIDDDLPEIIKLGCQ